MKPVADAGSPPTVRTLFVGSGSFAVPILDALARRPDLTIVAVVTPRDQPSGRRGKLTPVPVALAARRAGLPLLQVARIRAPEVVASIRALAPDLGVLADFGQLVPTSILEVPRLGMLNIHPSLLPRHRGATPIAATLMAGDTTAGVVIMQMDAGLDTGPLVAQRSWPLDGSEDAPALESHAAAEGATLLGEILPDVIAGRAAPVPQDDSIANVTRPLRREDGRLDPRSPAAALERQVRAYRPWPGSFVEVGGFRLVIREVEIRQSRRGDSVGILAADGDGLALTTIKGRLGLIVVHPAGGRSMEAAAFLRGRPELVGAAVTVPATMRVTRRPANRPQSREGS